MVNSSGWKSNHIRGRGCGGHHLNKTAIQIVKKSNWLILRYNVLWNYMFMTIWGGPARLPSQPQTLTVVALSLRVVVCWKPLDIFSQFCLSLSSCTGSGWFNCSSPKNWISGEEKSKNALYVVFKKDLPHEVFAQDCGYLLGGPPRPLGGRRHHPLRGLIINNDHIWIWNLKTFWRSVSNLKSKENIQVIITIFRVACEKGVNR